MLRTIRWLILQRDKFRFGNATSTRGIQNARFASTEQLVWCLVRDLRPVKRLARPTTGALVWVVGLLVAAVLVAGSTDLRAVGTRLAAAPDMWLSAVGSVLTSVAAGFAALEVSLPDRSSRWSMLPLPAAVLWLAASVFGCIRAALNLLSVHRATVTDSLRECLPFILGMSAPLALALGWMLYRSRPLRVGQVAILGGLASASGAASLLWLVHPFDASVVDIAVHGATVLVVVCVAWSIATYYQGAT